jgi:glycosyltransferase involved in cell wall biosynthesis
MTERPFFSIIMPVYNRAAVVGRALRSCLAQSFDSFEVVAVDDCSTDDSVAAIESFGDPRIRLVRHEQNRGPGPARNTGMANARGEWLVFLDSDDELLPGALEAIHRRAIAVGPEVGGLRFMCLDERGTSPRPEHRDEIFDYEGYLRWCNASVLGDRQETLPCVRASTFPGVQYPDSRALERWYHLELARTTNLQACSDVVRRYHNDAGNRLTVPVAARTLRYAPAHAEDADRVLTVHGEAMRRFAPNFYRRTLSSAAVACFLAGRRMDGLRYTMKAWRFMPFAPRLYAIVVLGLLGPRAVAEMQVLRVKMQSLRGRVNAG